MSSNPPILSIPHQLSSPASHIGRYLTSIRPHAEEHAHAGINHFQRVLETGSSKTSSSKDLPEGEEPIMFGKQRDNDDQGSDWLATRQEIMKRTKNTRKDINKTRVLISNDKCQLKTIQSNTFKKPLAAVKKINDFHMESKEEFEQSTKDTGGKTKDAETESAQREYLLQIERTSGSS